MIVFIYDRDGRETRNLLLFQLCNKAIKKMLTFFLFEMIVLLVFNIDQGMITCL